jgi:hypothetical protein
LSRNRSIPGCSERGGGRWITRGAAAGAEVRFGRRGRRRLGQPRPRPRRTPRARRAWWPPRSVPGPPASARYRGAAPLAK